MQKPSSDALFDRGELTLTVPPRTFVDAITAIKDAGYNAFEDMTAVDWLPSDPALPAQLPYPLAHLKSAFASRPGSRARSLNRFHHLCLARRQLL